MKYKLNIMQLWNKSPKSNSYHAGIRFQQSTLGSEEQPRIFSAEYLNNQNQTQCSTTNHVCVDTSKILVKRPFDFLGQFQSLQIQSLGLVNTENTKVKERK